MKTLKIGRQPAAASILQTLRPSRWAYGALAEPVVYFIDVDDNDRQSLIKIGLSEAPASRLFEFQAVNPYPLRIRAIAKGGLKREREYHKRFAHLRRHGEWFEADAELLAEIKRLGSIDTYAPCFPLHGKAA